MKPTVRVRVQFGQPPAAKPAPEAPQVTRVARLLALAWWIDEEIRAGRIENLAEAATQLGLTRARVTQVVNLRLMAPSNQEQLLQADAPSERMLRAVAWHPVWEQQARCESQSGRTMDLASSASNSLFRCGLGGAGKRRPAPLTRLPLSAKMAPK